jgi:hypothetical protein
MTNGWELWLISKLVAVRTTTVIDSMRMQGYLSGSYVWMLQRYAALDCGTVSVGRNLERNLKKDPRMHARCLLTVQLRGLTPPRSPQQPLAQASKALLRWITAAEPDIA